MERICRERKLHIRRGYTKSSRGSKRFSVWRNNKKVTV